MLSIQGMHRFALVVVIALGAYETAALQLMRGPYLQSVTHNSAIIMWRTDARVNSRVCFREAPVDGDPSTERCLDAPLHAADHTVKLAPLKADTKYAYTVGSTTERHTDYDPRRTFWTNPPPGQPLDRIVRIWVLGDSGMANDDARRTRDGFAEFVQGKVAGEATDPTATQARERRAQQGRPPMDLWLMLGDNAYFEGADYQYQGAVFDMYPNHLANVCLWPTMGNHDERSADSVQLSGAYYHIFELPRHGEGGGFPSQTEAYYSMDYGHIHLVALELTTHRVRDAQKIWLQKDLALVRQQQRAMWIIIILHQPPYTFGSHDSDWDPDCSHAREQLAPIWERFGVDLVLGGHSHDYERSDLMAGHYNKQRYFRAAKHVLHAGTEASPSDPWARPGDMIYQKRAWPLSATDSGTMYIVAGSSSKGANNDDHELEPPSPKVHHTAMKTYMKRRGTLVLDIVGAQLTGTFVGEKTHDVAPGTLLDLELDRFHIRKVKGDALRINGTLEQAGLHDWDPFWTRAGAPDWTVSSPHGSFWFVFQVLVGLLLVATACGCVVGYRQSVRFRLVVKDLVEHGPSLRAFSQGAAYEDVQGDTLETPRGWEDHAADGDDDQEEDGRRLQAVASMEDADLAGIMHELSTATRGGAFRALGRPVGCALCCMMDYLDLDDEIAEIEREIRILTEQLHDLVNSLCFLVGTWTAPVLLSFCASALGFQLPMAAPSYLRITPAESNAMSPLSVRLVMAAGNDMTAVGMAKPMVPGEALVATSVNTLRLYSVVERPRARAIPRDVGRLATERSGQSWA